MYPFPHFGATQGTADNNSGPGTSALTYFTPRSTDTYYIGVTSAGGSRRAGHYVLAVSIYQREVVANDDCEPGMNAAAHNAYTKVIFQYHYGARLGMPNTQADYEAASARVPGRDSICKYQVGETVTGRIEHNGLLSDRYSGSVLVPGDTDWFEFELTAGTRYRIEVETRANGMHNPGLGGIYDFDGVQVHDGNGSRGDSAYSERIHFEPTVGGFYFVEVSAGSNGPFNTGLYWLTVTEVS